MERTDLEPIAERLDALSDELADLAMGAVRDALDDGETSRPAIEKRLTRARRSVEKAAAILRQQPTSTSI